jgi:integrase
VQTRVSLDGKRVATGEPKTASGRRAVPIDPATVAALRTFKAIQAAERLAAGPGYANPGDLVAVDELGVPLRAEVFGDRFRRIARAANLPVIRLHDLRHTAASLLHESGAVSLRTLAAVLGHADPSFTLRTYAHSTDEAVTAATATLAGLLSAGDSRRL